MKKVFLISLLLLSNTLLGQEVALLFEEVSRMPSSGKLVREMFTRYSSTYDDAKILERVTQYKDNPIMRSQDLGRYQETLFKNRVIDMKYTKLNNPEADLTIREGGKRIKFQSKYHGHGRPGDYIRHANNPQYKNTLISMPKDHARRVIGKYPQLSSRVMPMHTTSREMERSFDRGITQIKKSSPSSSVLKNVGKKGLKSLPGVGMVIGVGFTGYESWSIHNEYAKSAIPKREMTKRYTSLGGGLVGGGVGGVAGAGGGAAIGTFIFPGIGTVVGGVIGVVLGGAGGAFAATKSIDSGFDAVYAKQDKETKYKIEDVVNKHYGYYGPHPKIQ